MPSLDALLQVDILVALFRSALSTQSLCALSRVSKLWRRCARGSECWAGKEVSLSTLDAREEDLLDWWPAWSKASRIFLRQSQARQSPSHLPANSAFEHLWGQWSVNAVGGWHRIYLDGHAFQACMTREETPDTAILIQDVSRGDRFHRGVWAGLTTAASPDMLSRLSSQIEGRGSHQFSDVLAVEIFAWDYEFLPEPGALYISTTMVAGTSANVPYLENLFFHYDEPQMVSVHHDRVGRHMTVETASGSLTIPFGQLLGGEILPAENPVRFFLAAPCAEDMAPNVRMLPTRPR